MLSMLGLRGVLQSSVEVFLKQVWAVGRFVSIRWHKLSNWRESRPQKLYGCPSSDVSSGIVQAHVLRGLSGAADERVAG